MEYKLLEENTYLDLLKESSNVDIKQEIVDENDVNALQVGNRIIVSLGPNSQTVIAIASGILVGKLLVGSYRFYKDYLTKYGKQCRDFKANSYGREKCLLRVKMQALEAQAKVLSNSKGECKKSKNPEKCIRQLDSKIFKIKSKITKYKLKMEKLPTSHEGR